MNDRDAGLQPERTALAWRRTALSVAFNAILFLRAGLQDQHMGFMVTGLGLSAGSIVLARLAGLRGADLNAGYRLAPHWLLPVTAGLVVAASVVAACSFALK